MLNFTVFMICIQILKSFQIFTNGKKTQFTIERLYFDHEKKLKTGENKIINVLNFSESFSGFDDMLLGRITNTDFFLC